MSDLKSPKELVVGYHGECLDGTVAAFSAYECFGDKADFIPLLHRNAPPVNLEGKEVFLLDIAFSSKVLESFRAKSITVLDHHDSLIDDLKGREGVFIDLNKSGAGITWDYLHPAEARPRLVDYVEDDDLGRWNLPWSKEVRCYLGIVHADTEPHDFEKWGNVLDEMESGPGFNNIVERGRDMVSLKLAEVKRTIQQTAHFVRYRGEKIPVVNSVNCVDDICAQYGPKYPFVIVWHGISGGRFKYSLRTSRNDVHVGEIAKVFGGGGRQKAAAFYSEFWILRLPGISYCEDK